MKTNTMRKTIAMLIVAILLSSFASAEEEWICFHYTWNAPLTTTGDLIGINYTIKNGSLHRNQVSGAREPIVKHETDAEFSNKLYSNKIINFDFETGNGISEVKVTAYVRADYLQDIDPEDYSSFMDEMVAKTVESKKNGKISRVFDQKVTKRSERFAYMVTEKGNHEISVWQYSDTENGYTLKGQATKATRATAGKTTVNKTETKPVETVVEEQPEQNQPEQDQPEQDQPEQDQPEQNQPEQDQPEQDQPEQDQPEQDQPEQDQPEQEQPEQEPAPEEDDIILAPQEEPEQEQPKQEEPEQEPEQEEPQNEPNQDEDAIVLVPRVDNADVTDQATGGKVVANPFN